MEERTINKAAADACQALGLHEDELFASRVYEDGRVVIVTTDGRKLEWRKSDETEQAAPRKGRGR